MVVRTPLEPVAILRRGHAVSKSKGTATGQGAYPFTGLRNSHLLRPACQNCCALVKCLLTCSLTDPTAFNNLNPPTNTWPVRFARLKGMFLEDHISAIADLVKGQYYVLGVLHAECASFARLHGMACVKMVKLDFY